MDLRFFDVEHGQCALLTCDNGNRLMIDCGHNATSGWMPGKTLEAQGVSVLDMLMITNYDEDHVSGFRDLDSRINIRWLVRNASVSGPTMYQLKSDTGIGPNMAHLANSVENFCYGVSANNPYPVFPGVSWEIYHNDYPRFTDENNLSLVVILSVQGVQFLFPGDMECDGWLALLHSNPIFASRVASTHVLLASHHGRENGICEELFDEYGCKPEIIIVSDDYHQYDTQQTVSYYGSKAKGIQGFRGESRWVLTTRCDGDLLFQFNANAPGCTVS